MDRAHRKVRRNRRSRAPDRLPTAESECVRLGADGVRGHTNAATCADFVPWNRTGDVIVSGGADRRLLVWNWVDEASDAARGLPVASIERDRKINDLAFAADSRAICVADTSPTLKLFALR